LNNFITKNIEIVHLKMRFFSFLSVNYLFRMDTSYVAEQKTHLKKAV